MKLAMLSCRTGIAPLKSDSSSCTRAFASRISKIKRIAIHQDGQNTLGIPRSFPLEIIEQAIHDPIIQPGEPDRDDLHLVSVEFDLWQAWRDDRRDACTGDSPYKKKVNAPTFGFCARLRKAKKTGAMARAMCSISHQVRRILADDLSHDVGFATPARVLEMLEKILESGL